MPSGGHCSARLSDDNSKMELMAVCADAHQRVQQMSVSNTLLIRVWTTREMCEIGVLKFGLDEVTIKLESGRVISDRNSGDVQFEPQNMIRLDSNGQSVRELSTARMRIYLKPVVIAHHPYTNHGGQIVEDIFPPSTSGFYGRLLSGKDDSLFFVQKIMNSKQFLLTITDSPPSRIYETLIIQPYEAEALALIEDFRIRLMLFGQSSINKGNTREEVLSILDTPAPSWQELANTIEDVSIPNLKMGATMRDIFDQIVPAGFPTEIREELMAFLAYVIRIKIPNEDPLTYSFRFSSAPTLENLITGHFMHLIDKTKWPSYVKLMIMAARGQLEPPRRAVPEPVLSSPWNLYIQKCAELTPNWLSIAIDSAMELNDSSKIVLGLPTTKSAASRSRQSWKKRFAEISHGLRMRGHIESAALGLVELVYLGAAYRWPHRHMKFISRLGSKGEVPPYIQVMLMPIAAAERVKRTIPSITRVAWSARTSNLHLFDKAGAEWHMPIQRVVDSVGKRGSLKRLMRQFGSRGPPEAYIMSAEEAKIADLVSEGVNLSFLELPEFYGHWEPNKRRIRGNLSNLIKRRIMHLSYEVSDPRLVSLATIMQGRRETITSIAMEFLRSTPTSYVRIDETGESGIILSRLPEVSIYEIASQLTSRGIDYGLNIRCMRPAAFRSYTSNLYQRLLGDDGTWDDDVSAFLSQARSKRKELSKSNP